MTHADASPERVSARDRAEANAVTTTHSGHQYELQLGHLCNNRCVFCASGQLTQLKIAKTLPIEPMLTALEEAAKAGARRVTFLGGEPTLHRAFPEALKKAVDLGFPEIVIFTNGVLLPQPGFLDRVCALGSFEWRLSIQGSDEASHVAVTKKPDSFRRIIEGLRMLRARGQRVTANLCVNTESYRSLPGYPALVKEHGLAQLHVDIVRPSSIGQYTPEYLRAIQPRYSEMAPYFREMLSRFEQELPGFDVNVGNLPFCILPEWAPSIGHGGEPTVTQSCDAGGLAAVVEKYEWHASMRRHTPRCDPCLFRAQCTGIFDEYLALYGDDEFQPVTRETLVQLDPGGRNFALLAAPRLALLQRAETPKGLLLLGWHERRRDRHVELEYASEEHPDEVALRLRLSPSTSDEASMVRLAGDAQLALWARLDRPVKLDRLEALLQHVTGHVGLSLAPEGLATLIRPHVVESLRGRMERLSARFARLPGIDGFVVVGVRHGDASTSLALSRADGATAHADVSVRAEGLAVKLSMTLETTLSASEAMRLEEALRRAVGG